MRDIVLYFSYSQVIKTEQIKREPPGFVRVVFLCAVRLFSDQKEFDLQSGCN